MNDHLSDALLNLPLRGVTLIFSSGDLFLSHREGLILDGRRHVILHNDSTLDWVRGKINMKITGFILGRRISGDSFQEFSQFELYTMLVGDNIFKPNSSNKFFLQNSFGFFFSVPAVELPLRWTPLLQAKFI